MQAERRFLPDLNHTRVEPKERLSERQFVIAGPRFVAGESKGCGVLRPGGWTGSEQTEGAALPRGSAVAGRRLQEDVAAAKADHGHAQRQGAAGGRAPAAARCRSER